MAIFALGSVNTAALNVPGNYVAIVPPQIQYINGVSTGILGLVGTAAWGPVDAPTTIGNYAEFTRTFSALQPRRYDLGTAVAIATQQGANDMACVRITDGTDTAAFVQISSGSAQSLYNTVAGTGYTSSPTITITRGTGDTTGTGFAMTATVSNGSLVYAITNHGTGYTQNPQVSFSGGGGTGAAVSVSIGAVTVTSLYTGSGGNVISVTFAAGSAVVSGYSSWVCTVAAIGLAATPEVFQILQPSTSAFWPVLVSAINNGTSQRGASQLIVMSAPGTSGGPNIGITYTLTGGTDGAFNGGATSASTALIGVDGTVRTGMYALRNTGASVAVLVDCCDSTTWSTQVPFGIAEGIYMIDAGPSGDTLSNAPTVKMTAGIDTYAMKILFGDWIYWLDSVNGLTRLVPPSAFSAGLIANLSPEESSLNKQIQAIVGTQKSASNTQYSQADLLVLANAGIDVIANPCPGGSYFGANIGRNASSNAVIHGDNYTRLTNFIAATINKWMGQVVGLLQNPTTRRQAFNLLDQFFYTLWGQGIIGNADGTQPYRVILDDTNNPPARVALGYMQANVQVQYQSVIEYMLTEIEGGQSVQITRQAVAPASSS